jgi:antitoxin ParD1/3/4
VTERISRRGDGTRSEHACGSVREDRDGQRLRRMLLDGAASARTAPVDDTYFDRLRERVRHAMTARDKS